MIVLLSADREPCTKLFPQSYAGRAFHAHEVLEGTWKATEGVERPLWQGLAQLATRRSQANRALAWTLAGGVLMAHDWKDRAVWFRRGS